MLSASIFASEGALNFPSSQMFQLDLFYDAPDGELTVAPPTHIMNELHKILTDTVEACPCPVGVLTTEHRDTWYQARKRLSEGTYSKKCFITLARVGCVVGFFARVQ